MSWLDQRQSELVFDYCLGQCCPAELAEAEDLIGSSEAARELCARIEAALLPLSCVSVPSCPDRLAESTIRRANQEIGQATRRQQAKPRAVPVHSYWRAVPAVAAAVVVACSVLVAGILFISLPPTPDQRPRQVSPQNVDDPLWIAGPYRADRVQFRVIDANRSLMPSPAISWPGEDYPYPVYSVPEWGPQVLPAYGPARLGDGSPNRSVGPVPATTTDQAP